MLTNCTLYSIKPDLAINVSGTGKFWYHRSWTRPQMACWHLTHNFWILFQQARVFFHSKRSSEYFWGHRYLDAKLGAYIFTSSRFSHCQLSIMPHSVPCRPPLSISFCAHCLLLLVTFYQQLCLHKYRGWLFPLLVTTWSVTTQRWTKWQWSAKIGDQEVATEQDTQRHTGGANEQDTHMQRNKQWERSRQP